jgi:hypothetical protein
VGDGGCQSVDIEPLSDLGARLAKQTPIYLYHGSKDETAPFGHVHLYVQTIPQAVVRRLSGRDDQLNNDMSAVAADIQRLILREVDRVDHAARAASNGRLRLTAAGAMMRRRGRNASH